MTWNTVRYLCSRLVCDKRWTTLVFLLSALINFKLLPIALLRARINLALDLIIQWILHKRSAPSVLHGKLAIENNYSLLPWTPSSESRSDGSSDHLCSWLLQAAVIPFSQKITRFIYFYTAGSKVIQLQVSTGKSRIKQPQNSLKPYDTSKDKDLADGRIGPCSDLTFIRFIIRLLK